MTVVTILGSGPNVISSQDWKKSGLGHVLTINNAWRVRSDWDALIHPEDFPQDRRPVEIATGQTVVTAADYIPANNAYGGVVYAGGTMAFTAAYWAMWRHRPRVLAVMGCDMVYPVAVNTHFYGTGTADPLRPDMTLQSLEAKSARILLLAARQGCAVVNLSVDQSRLVFPRAKVDRPAHVHTICIDENAVRAALQAEQDLGARIPSGRYWAEGQTIDPAALARIDAMWLQAHDSSLAMAVRLMKATHRHRL
ncbi:MAG: hypothetical protein ACU0B7_06710 [Paracoccaceae bacterium]|uniref:hypothetical protein n=1 Tax=Seohaeicola saemankumensis TaxID=481181 RepID=UPI001E29F9A6|nr:hypothetical protein [Seohaeicola saemankumensis]MCD1624534.1 hypothetical protein [Seohaeicola saemankumensis]